MTSSPIVDERAGGNDGSNAVGQHSALDVSSSPCADLATERPSPLRPAPHIANRFPPPARNTWRCRLKDELNIVPQRKSSRRSEAFGRCGRPHLTAAAAKPHRYDTHPWKGLARSPCLLSYYHAGRVQVYVGRAIRDDSIAAWHRRRCLSPSAANIARRFSALDL